MPVVIEIRRAGRPVETREFGENRITVGRDAGGIVLHDPQASARHAEIMLTPRGVQYRDVGSTNGSFLEDGRRLAEPHSWTPGMKILIGNSALVLVSSALPNFGPMGTLVLTGKDAKDVLGPFTEPLPARIDVAEPAPPAAKELAAPAAAVALEVAEPIRSSEVARTREPSRAVFEPAKLEPAAVVPEAGALKPEPADLEPDDARISDNAPVSQDSVSALEFLWTSWRMYQPHALRGSFVLGALTFPLALLSAASLGNSVLHALLLPLTSFGYAVVFFLFGLGAQAEFALRVYDGGSPGSVRSIWDIQSRRLISWPVELLLPLLVTFGGFVLTIPAFAPLLLPVYMIERKVGLQMLRRSFDLLTRGVFFALLPPVCVVVLVTAVLAALTAGVEMIPRVGPLLACLVAPLGVAAAMPFLSFLQFRAYGELVERSSDEAASNSLY